MQKYISIETRVQNLQFSQAWDHLSTKEQNYAYYLMKASWAGALSVVHTLSYEAPGLFLMFQSFFQTKDFDNLKAQAQVSDLEWNQFLAYVAGFYANLSNYHSFGHMKFIPELSQEVFKKIIMSNSQTKQIMEKLYPLVEKEIFSIDKPYTQLNYPENGGVTGYFSRNMSKDDLKIVQDFLKQEKIDVLNTRAFKNDDHILITIASIDKDEKTYTFQNQKIVVKRGEFCDYLSKLNQYLEQAINYAANENQINMIKDYICHFKTGDIETHKNSQRWWIKDKKPIIESNLGWIETYIDPENVRAYYEGWVAIVDKEKSKKFENLVKNSQNIIPQLPWPKYMEKDTFLAPDFVTLEVIGFATNSCPLGINIPNYDDIRDNEGFKNVFLNNSMPNYQAGSIQFATEEQSKILKEHSSRCYEVHVACHELLGHGVGKLIYGSEKNMPEFVDPVDQKTYKSCYFEGETWNSKFGSISTSYEECRADTCGFYLCTLPEVYTIFNIEESFVTSLLWVNVMNQFRKGILGLNLYNPETKKWGQAHTQGAFVFAMYLYKNQKSDIVSFEIVDNNFYIHLNEELLNKEGKSLIKELLYTLQVYKAHGAFERAQEFYQTYSEVSDYFLKVREIVIETKKPRRLELNNNLVRYNENTIKPFVYPECFEGIIYSYAERYPFDQTLFDSMYEQFLHDGPYLRV